MQVITTRGDNAVFQHFVDTDYYALLEVKRQSWIRAQEVSDIVCINEVDPKWLLTVKDTQI